MLKFYARHGMIVYEVHGINSFKEVKCLEKNIILNTQKRKLEANDFWKGLLFIVQKPISWKKNKIY